MPAYTITAEAPPLAPAAAPQSFAERCIASIDAKLAAMAPADRLPALRQAQVNFIALSEEFASRVDGGHAPKWGECAFDYPILLADISIRIAREVRR